MVIQRPQGRLVYPSIGMLSNSVDGKNSPILYAYVPTGTSNIVAVTPSGEELVYENPTFGERTLIQNMSFSVDGEDITIRPVYEEDGMELSQYGISLPVQAVKALISPENHLLEKEGLMATYFKDGTEEMYALSNDDGDIVGIMYINGFGIYKRVGGVWVAMTPGDMSFDMTTPHVVNPETAEELVDMFDEKPVTAEDISSYVTPVK